MRPRRLDLRSISCALVVAVALGSASALPAADPFYDGMLAEGREALARGDLPSALLELEIAAFGLLEDPPRLADALTHLALAQAAAGQERALEATLERVLEVESRFGGYRQAEIPAATRHRFEELLLRRVALARLERIEAFRPLAQQHELEALRGMRPGERRSLLERRLERQPDDFRSLQLLADLELEEGRPRVALDYFDRLVELGGEDPILVCRRFRAAARAGACSTVVGDLSRCEEVALEPDLAEPVLDCLVAGDDPATALAFVETLPAPLRRKSKIRKTERQLERRLEARERAARLEAEGADEPSGDATPSASGEAGSPPESPAGPPPEPSTDLTSTARSAPADATSAADPPTSPAATEAEASEVDSCAGFRRAALSRRCAEALGSLELCRTAAEEPEVAERIAKCLADADRWTDLTQFVADLPPQVGGRPKLRKLERRAAKRAPTPTEEATPTEEPAPTAARAPAEAPSDDDGVPGRSVDAVGGEPPTSPAAETTSASTATPPTTEPDASTLAAMRRQLSEARTAEALDAAVRAAFQLAGRFPSSTAVQLVAAEAAYRAALWEEAVRFFELAGDIADDRPLLLFYRAVSLYEVGRAGAALPYLERSLPKLRKTPFVESYADRIRRAARD